MRKACLTAAAGLAAALAISASGHSASRVAHTCSATDRQFINTAQLNMASLGAWSEDYLKGNAKAKDVLDATRTASVSFRSTEPSDPSLAKTRAILTAMFVEYSKAIQADARHRDSGHYIYRAYGLANFAHDVLSQAQPGLLKHGCDVGPLL